MIKCPECGNENQETIDQHDRSLAGYRDYGREFTCFLCRASFYVGKDEASEDIITKFPGV